MVRKRMSSAVQKAVSDHALAQKGGERLTDSITGSLRIEGYEVKREDVAQIVEARIARVNTVNAELVNTEASAEVISERETDE